MPNPPVPSGNQALHPIPLTLALWLGMIVGVTGLTHLSKEMSASVALAPNTPPVVVAISEPILLVSDW